MIDPLTGALLNRRDDVYNIPELKLFFMVGQPSHVAEEFCLAPPPDKEWNMKDEFAGIMFASAMEAMSDMLRMSSQIAVACKPYHTLTEVEHEDLKTRSSPLESSHVDIIIDKNAKTLAFHDKLTQTISTYSFNCLDPDIAGQPNKLTVPCDRQVLSWHP